MIRLWSSVFWLSLRSTFCWYCFRRTTCLGFEEWLFVLSEVVRLIDRLCSRQSRTCFIRNEKGVHVLPCYLLNFETLCHDTTKMITTDWYSCFISVVVLMVVKHVYWWTYTCIGVQAFPLKLGMINYKVLLHSASMCTSQTIQIPLR